MKKVIIILTATITLFTLCSCNKDTRTPLQKAQDDLAEAQSQTQNIQQAYNERTQEIQDLQDTYDNYINFANNRDIIDDVLLSAYGTLESYSEFDFVKENPVFEKIQDVIDTLVPKQIGGNETIHQIASSIDSPYLLSAAEKTFENDPSISSKLILLDLKLNCLKKVNFAEINHLKKEFDDSNEKFASRILDSIVGQYLSFNRCNYSLRSRLCSLCGFSERETLKASQQELLS